jgi:putative nucleotidyltransferase with HDIG domain
VQLGRVDKWLRFAVMAPGHIAGATMHTTATPTPVLPAKGTRARRFERPSATPGQRLVTAFAAIENLPALAHTRDKLLRVLEDPHASSQEIVLTIESDVALAIAVLRAGDPEGSARRANVADCVGYIGDGLSALAEKLPTFDFFDRSNALTAELARLRLHALATQAAVQRICDELQQPVSGQVSVAALLHDIGKVILGQAAPQYDELLRAPATPEQLVRVEQQAFGIDHAAAGGAALRRLGLPVELTVAVENHHSAHAQGDAAVVRAADMLAHYEALGRIDAGELTHAAALIGIDGDALRRLLYNSPRVAAAGRPHLDPCPLSKRQLDVLRLLRDGKRYKEIAADLGLSDSTVRSHTNVAYRRLGVSDRAQAVLRATARGWI